MWRLEPRTVNRGNVLKCFVVSLSSGGKASARRYVETTFTVRVISSPSASSKTWVSIPALSSTPSIRSSSEEARFAEAVTDFFLAMSMSQSSTVDAPPCGPKSRTSLHAS